MAEHVHQEIGDEIRSVAGYYQVLEEGVLEYNGLEVLYLVEAAEVDTSCCGSGGMGFILVPGYIRSWKHHKSESGLWVSEVDRVEGGEDRKKIEKLLKDKYPNFHQVSFA